MPGGIRVNSRVFSDEIAHGLGAGAVDIRLSLEFADKARDGETALLYGNSEVFKGKIRPVPPFGQKQRHWFTRSAVPCVSACGCMIPWKATA